MEGQLEVVTARIGESHRSVGAVPNNHIFILSILISKIGW